VQWDWHGGDNQRFTVEAGATCSTLIRAKHAGKVLDVAGEPKETVRASSSGTRPAAPTSFGVTVFRSTDSELAWQSRTRMTWFENAWVRPVTL
jgi:hypothetical protein